MGALSGYVLAVFLGLVAIVAGHKSRLELEWGNHPRRLCGKALSDTLNAACNGMFNSLFDKKSITEDYQAQSEQEYVEPESEYQPPQFPFRSRVEARSSMYPRIFRRSSGISNECCQKPCYYSELASYCAPPRF